MSKERQEQKEQPDRAGAAERVERAQQHIARAEKMLRDSTETAGLMERLGNLLSGLLSRGSDR